MAKNLTNYYEKSNINSGTMAKIPSELEKQLEELLEKIEIYQYFLNEMNVGFYIIKTKVPIPINLPEDEQIKMIYEHAYIADCNDALAKMYGFSNAEELKGKKVAELHGGPDVSENIEAHRQFIRSGYRIIGVETLEFDKEGNKKWFRNSVVGIIKNGAIVALMGTQTDITVAKEIEERLKNSEKEKELILNSVAELITFQDKNLKVIWANKSAGDSLGLDSSTLIGHHCYELWHKRDKVCENCPVDKAIRTGQFQEGEIRTPDGRVWFIKGYPVKDEKGEIIGAIEVTTEITEKVKTEERIKLQQKYFEGIFEFSPLAMVITDKNGKIIRINPEFERLFGWKEDEIKSVFLDDIIIEPERKEEALSVTKRVADGESIILEGIRIKKDRTPVYVTIIGHPIVVNDEVIAQMGIYRDITEKKRMEEAIKKSEEKYRKLFEESKDGIFISTPDGKILDVNPAIVEIYGYSSKEELIKTPIEKLYLNPGEREEYRKKLEKDGFVKDYELRGRRKDGTSLVLIETSTVEKDEKGNVISYRGIVRDVTAQRKMEEQLIQSVKMEAIGRLAGGIAHDFNNILTVISGNAELLLTKFPPESSEFKKVKQIIESSRKATELTKQLLTISKRGISEPVVLNLNQTIDDMKDILKRLIGEDIEFEFILEPSLKNIKADRTHIEQILMNLVVNARDAMPKGGKLTIKTENIFLDEEYCAFYPDLKAGEYILLSIADTGAGIPPEILPKIFEPFFSTKPDGTGLGLSTVYGIVKQLGGNITVYSEVGKGTTFHIYIPVCREKVEKEYEEKEELENLPKGNETILVIDDEKQILEYIEAVLSPLGYNLITATSEKEAMEKLKNFAGKINLLLTDVVLPGKSGPEIAKEMVFMKPDIKVLFMSGYPDEKLQVSEILQGKVNFMGKPFTPVALARKVREILDKK